MTEAREKTRKEISKVESLEREVEKLTRSLDNALEEVDEFGANAFELEEQLNESKREKTILEGKLLDAKEISEEIDTDDFDALKSILISLGVDVDELLEAVKEEDDIWEFYETPAYANLVLRPIAEELDSKEFDREDDD